MDVVGAPRRQMDVVGAPRRQMDVVGATSADTLPPTSRSCSCWADREARGPAASLALASWARSCDTSLRRARIVASCVNMAWEGV